MAARRVARGGGEGGRAETAGEGDGECGGRGGGWVMVGEAEDVVAAVSGGRRARQGLGGGRWRG